MKRFFFLTTALFVSGTLMLMNLQDAEGQSRGGRGGSTGGRGGSTGGHKGGSTGHKGGSMGHKGGKSGGSHSHARSHNRGYRGWSHYCWFPSYRCYGYYSPTDACWYYWYGPGNCYLPVSEMENKPPDDSVNVAPA